MMNLGIGIGIPFQRKSGGAAPAPVGLLNTAEGVGAAFAISLRMLNANLIGQDAIEVIRVSDSATQRFPLTATGVDTAAISSFCGSSDGRVSWMLDQSGNSRHAAQTALSSAPKIYDSTTGIVTENGKPALQFEGSHFLTTAPFASVIPQPTTHSNVFRLASEGVQIFYDGDNARNLLSTGSSQWSMFAGNTIRNTDIDTLQHVISQIFSGANSEQYIDGSLVLTGDAGSQGIDKMAIGATASGAAAMTGFYQEHILWPVSKKTVIADINNDIKTHYGIS